MATGTLFNRYRIKKNALRRGRERSFKKRCNYVRGKNDYHGGEKKLRVKKKENKGTHFQGLNPPEEKSKREGSSEGKKYSVCGESL